jgi:hypothetical protein
MPDFEMLSIKEAQFRTIPGRQGKFLNEYADYIQQLPPGQAGKLSPVENEKPLTIRRRLMQAAHALGTNLIIKRSGTNVYFWREGTEEAQSRSKRRYTRRRGTQDEITAPDQPFTEPEEFEQAVSEQTTVSDAV